jgi:hypothetical protein
MIGPCRVKGGPRHFRKNAASFRPCTTVVPPACRRRPKSSRAVTQGACQNKPDGPKAAAHCRGTRHRINSRPGVVLARACASNTRSPSRSRCRLGGATQMRPFCSTSPSPARPARSRRARPSSSSSAERALLSRWIVTRTQAGRRHSHGCADDKNISVGQAILPVPFRKPAESPCRCDARATARL